MADTTFDNDDFTPGDDLVTGQVTDPDDDQVAVEQNDALVEAQAGDDTIIGEVDVTVDTQFGLKLVGVQINGTLLMEDGNDSLIGDVNAEIDGESNTTVIGIRDTVENTIDMGDGDDEVVGTAFATVTGGDNTKARGIFNGTIIMAAGLDSVSGSATIVAGAGTEGNDASGIKNSYVNTGVGQDEVEGEAALLGGNDDVSGSAVGIEYGDINTLDGDDAVTGTATVAVGDDTGENFVTASGIYGAGIDTGEGEDDVTGHADITTGDDYGIFNSHGIYLESDQIAISLIEPINGYSATMTTGADADRVAGRVDVATGDGSTIEYVTGIGSGGLSPASIDTGAGNDDLTGLVEISGGEDTSAVGIFGIHNSTIHADGDNDTVVGAVVATLDTDSTLTDSAGIAGPAELMTAETIEGGSGNDITAGLLLAPGAGADPGLSADSIQAIVDNTSPNAILAWAGGVINGPTPDPAAFIDFAMAALGTGADGLGIANVAGIMNETVVGGTGTDLTVGLVATTVGDDNAIVENSDGIRDSVISTGAGENGPYAGDSAADFVGGISVNIGGEDADLSGNDGIDCSLIDVDSGGAFVAGVSVNAVGADGSSTNNSGIYDSQIYADSAGEKSILGISVTEGGDDSVHGNINGISYSTIETGRDDDFVLGASVVSSDSGDVTAEGNGIDNSTIYTKEGDDLVIADGITFGIEDSEIYLGDGNDTIVARGGEAGVNNVTIDGGGGDDVFNIHSGFATIYGEEDDEDTGDTLVLAGTFEDYTFVEYASADDDDWNIVDATSDVPDTDIDAFDIENFVFIESGVTLTGDDIAVLIA